MGRHSKVPAPGEKNLGPAGPDAAAPNDRGPAPRARRLAPALAALREARWALVVFLVVAVVQGAYYINNIGALTMPDPLMHSLGSYALATGQALNPCVEVTDTEGNARRVQTLAGDSRYLLTKETRNDMISAIIAGPFPTDPARDAQIAACAEEGFGMELPPTEEVERDTGITVFHGRSNQYFPLAWLPQALGIRVGISLGWQPYDVWQAGRVSSLVCYLALYGAAIAIAPRMRWVLVALGLIPTTLFAASSLMCDAFLVSLCTLSVALTLRLVARGRRVRTGEALALGCVAALALLGKVVYAPACLGFLVLPRRQLDARGKVVATAPVALALVAYLAWSATIGDMAAIVNLRDNIAYAVAHLGTVAARIGYMVLNLPAILLNGDGVYLGFALVVAALLAWEALRARRGEKDGAPADADPSDAALAPAAPTWRDWLSGHRYVVGAVVAGAASVAGILLFLLLTWNDLAAGPDIAYVEGFQGRYLLPLWPLLLYASTVLPAPAARR